MGKINIKNYTTTIPASTSISTIEKLLVSAGARNIMKRYNEYGVTQAITFGLPVNGKQLSFDVEAKVDPLYDLFLAEYVKPTSRSETICLAQAERTAWKLIQEWVHINISMIQLEQAETLEMFFPKLTNGKETFYASLKADDFKLLLPPVQ